MTGKVINLFEHIRGDRKEAHAAVMRAIERPLPVPQQGAPAVSREYFANWFLEGLWLEGFKVVRCPEEGE